MCITYKLLAISSLQLNDWFTALIFMASSCKQLAHSCKKYNIQQTSKIINIFSETKASKLFAAVMSC